MTNDIISVKHCANLDVVSRVSKDLENENIELSNEKIVKILSALRQITKAHYQGYIKQLGEQQALTPETGEKEPAEVL